MHTKSITDNSTWSVFSKEFKSHLKFWINCHVSLGALVKYLGGERQDGMHSNMGDIVLTGP